MDVDLVEFHDEDFRDITAILKLSDTMKDKLTFTVSWLLKVDLACTVSFYDVMTYWYIVYKM